MSAHHVWHWTKGGPTDFHNLVELCRFHHRLVHEGRWDQTFDPQTGIVTFTSPTGTVVAGGAPASGTLETANTHRGVTVTARTVMPDHHAPLDLAITSLIPPGQADPYRRN